MTREVIVTFKTFMTDKMDPYQANIDARKHLTENPTETVIITDDMGNRELLCMAIVTHKLGKGPDEC